MLILQLENIKYLASQFSIKMKVTEHLKRSKDTLLSYEILPPLKGTNIQSIYNHLDPLMEFKPSWINVTYHRSETILRTKDDGNFEKIVTRKRPGTVGICSAIMNYYSVDAVPHIICGGFSKSETEEALIDLNFLGIDNVLALRGDAARDDDHFIPHTHGHSYAVDLVKQIVDMNGGKFLDNDIKNADKTDFCIGVAGYPEKHFECKSFEEDLLFLKKKVDAGAEYIMTQMFFDNNKFFKFVEACRSLNINVPIIPGLKPLTTKAQLKVIPKIFSTELPKELVEEIEKTTNDADTEKVGTEWLIQQSKELKKYGVPVLHYYTLGKPSTIRNVIMEVL